MRKVFCGTSGSAEAPNTHYLSTINAAPEIIQAFTTFYGRDISLRPAQDAALFTHNLLCSDESVLIATPTNSGKSLLSYLLLFKDAIAGKTVFLVEPLRALAYEKTEELKRIADILKRQSRIKVNITITTGDYRLTDEFMHSAPANPDGSARGQIIIATPERLDALSRVAENREWFERISLVCFDEAHLLGDAHRGAALELLIAFLRSLRTQMRIILMSATISNSGDLAEWLSPCGIISDAPRYPTLDKWVYCIEGNEVVDEILAEEITQILRDETKSVLVFVYQTASAEKLAKLLAKKLAGRPVRQDLDSTMAAGVAWFHARLSAATKERIIKAMSSGQIRVAVSTTALSMGINLPATHVFVRDISFTGFGDLDVSDLMQMIGRAGRGNNSGVGTVILSGSNLSKESTIVSGLTNETTPEIRSQLIPAERDGYYGAPREDFQYIDRVGNQLMGIINRYGTITINGLNDYLGFTFGGNRFENLPSILQKLSDWKLAYLNEDTNEYELTHLGKVSAKCYIAPLTAANTGQLFRDLLEDDPSGGHIHHFAPIDYLITLCLVSDENKPLTRYSRALETKVHSYMEALPFNEKSYLYRTWISSTPEALYGSARVDSSSADSRKRVYQATYTAMLIYDISRGLTQAQLDVFYKLDTEEIQERIRDNALWILCGLEQLLEVKSFYYHLKENCHAEYEQIQSVDNAFKKSSSTIFTLVGNLKFRSKLGELVRGIKNVFPHADSYPGEGTIHKLEGAGISSLMGLVGKTQDDLVRIGIRAEYANLIVDYMRRRMA